MLDSLLMILPMISLSRISARSPSVYMLFPFKSHTVPPLLKEGHDIKGALSHSSSTFRPKPSSSPSQNSDGTNSTGEA